MQEHYSESVASIRAVQFYSSDKQKYNAVPVY